MPTPAQLSDFQKHFPDNLLLRFPKDIKSLARDYKWLGSHRYGVMHLGGRDATDLEQRCRAASAQLGWPAPYAEQSVTNSHQAPCYFAQQPISGVAS